MSVIITSIDCTMEPRLRLGRPLLPAGLGPGTARSADQRLTYLATELLPVCRDMQAQVHVSPPASLNT